MGNGRRTTQACSVSSKLRSARQRGALVTIASAPLKGTDHHRLKGAENAFKLTFFSDLERARDGHVGHATTLVTREALPSFNLRVRAEQRQGPAICGALVKACCCGPGYKLHVPSKAEQFVKSSYFDLKKSGG